MGTKSRSPHGERGLKSGTGAHGHTGHDSLPAWGAWIEMWYHVFSLKEAFRSPHGERGLKFAKLCQKNIFAIRSPHGERGLK